MPFLILWGNYMSVWCEVVGQITMNVNEHCSIRDAIKESFDEVSMGVVQSNRYNGTVVTDVNFCFCSEGVHAANKIDMFISNMKTKYKSVRADLTAEIRFFY